MLRIIDKLYGKKISSKGLGVFRIFFSFVLLLEVFRIFRYRQLYFDPIPFVETSALSAEIPFVIWMFVIFMLVIGAFTRVMAIINYIFVIVYISSISAFEYHMDYTYTGVSFILMFFSVSKSYSIDRLFEKLKFSSLTYLHEPKEKTSVLNYWLLLFVGIGLVYLDSVFQKSYSNSWLNGLGMWLPASIPQLTIFNNQWLLNQEFLIKFLGYFTLFFELVFSFIFWIKRFRVPLLIIGIGLHLGILIEFPIPYFALGVIAIYMLMTPNHFWKTLERKIQAKQASLTLFFDAECPLCMKTRILLSFFDVFNKLDFKSVQESINNTEELAGFSEEELLINMHAIDSKGNIYSGIETYKKVFLLTPVFFALGVLLHIPCISHIAKLIYKYVAKNRNIERCTAENCGFLPAPKKMDRDEIMLLGSFKTRNIKIIALAIFVFGVIFLQIMVNFKQPFSNDFANTLHSNVKKASSKLLGITIHGVFLDSHYTGYDKVYSLEHNGDLLPIFNNSGMPAEYLVGGIWANFGFRVNRPYVDNHLNNLKIGLTRYSAFWAYKNNIDLSNAEFKIIKKNVRVSYTWERDLLTNNIITPWEEVGIVIWKSNQATFELQE